MMHWPNMHLEKDYEVDPVYVLVLYRYSKVNWMLDFVICAGIGVFLLLVGSVIIGGIKNAVRGKEKNALNY